MRGEHGFLVGHETPELGPPPRARGALTGGRAACVNPGTTPACAGNTRSQSSPVTVPRDHPRVRGEHLTNIVLDQAERGPPPRARGARGACHPDRVGVGTTPACAESTEAPPASPDQPEGPPPRARGARRGYGRSRPGAGTTPACAGSTRGRVSCWCGGWDHPRVRGEHRGLENGVFVKEGPPPRARGALWLTCAFIG